MGKDLKGKELGLGLSQRKDGRYSARFTSVTGKRIESYFLNLSEAKQWLYKTKYEDDNLNSGNLTVDEWYNFWITNYKEDIKSDSTVRNYKMRYKLNIKNTIGGMQLKEVKHIHCQQIINKMFDSGEYAYGTMELTQITMHSLFKSAIANKYIKSNPAEGLEIKCRDVQEERRVLTRDEQRTLKKYCSKTQYANAFLLVLETGLRVGEIGGLQWDDINFEEKYLTVKRTLLQDASKGGFYFGTPKTTKSKRKIPLTDEAIRLLKEQKVTQNKLKYRSLDWDKSWDGLVFTTLNGKPVGASTFRMMLVRVVNRINLDRRASSENGIYEEFKHTYMHSLRHTFATRAIENGVQPKALQSILGHSSLAITMDLYVHVTDEQSFSEMQKMNTPI